MHRITQPLAGLYAITDDKLIADDHFAVAVEQALLGGARIVQYRDKSADEARRLAQARIARQLCYEYDALFIVNDDVGLAGHSNADGIHLGRHDTSVDIARQSLGEDCVIGVSCYNDFERARQAHQQGADYVAFGAFFSSPTKPGAVTADVSLLQRARDELDIPVCAIGGITCVNAGPLVAAGADMVAVVSDVFGAQDVRRAAEQFTALFM